MDEELKLTGFQTAIKTLTGLNFKRLPTNCTTFPAPGEYLTKIIGDIFALLVRLPDAYTVYTFDVDGTLLERLEIPCEQEETNIPEAEVEIFTDGEIREKSEDCQELADEG
jgi:hypothetical protein